LKVGFNWQTWRRGSELPSFCHPPAAYNSKNILTTSVGNYLFNYTRDHAKWGISDSGNWACVGDINRMTTQRKRGGGTVCLQSLPLVAGLGHTIKLVQPCSAIPPSSIATTTTTTDHVDQYYP